MNIFTGVAAGWLGRRALELGGLIGTIFAFWAALPPGFQEVITRLITGKWQDVTLGALVPLLVYVVSQVLSFRATVKPQIVTDDGLKVSTDKLPRNKKTLAEEAARVAAEKAKAGRKPNIFDKLFGR